MTYSDAVKPYYPYTQVRPEEVDAAYKLLRECAYNISPENQHMRMTPYRLAHYLNYWTRSHNEPRFTVFDNVDPVIDQMIVVGPTHFWACCSHHLLPFFGTVWFGYIPDEKLVGLSMVPLLIREECARPWLQENMTAYLADGLQEELEPNGLGIVTKATHTCQMLDLGGPPVPEMTFSVMKGSFFNNEKTRAEFFTHIGKEG